MLVCLCFYVYHVLLFHNSSNLTLVYMFDFVYVLINMFYYGYVFLSTYMCLTFYVYLYCFAVCLFFFQKTTHFRIDECREYR